nr:TPA_asm: hypothetical protein [Schistorhabdovirus]
MTIDWKALDEVNAIVSTSAQQTKYSDEIWANVDIYKPCFDSLSWIGYIILSSKDLEPSEATARALSSLAFLDFDGKPMPTSSLPKALVMRPAECNLRWNPESIEKLFVKTTEITGVTEKELAEHQRQEHTDQEQTASVSDVLTAYGYPPSERTQPIRITKRRLFVTLWSALFIIPRYYRKSLLQGGDVKDLVTRLCRINPEIEGSLLGILLNEFIHQKKWEVFVGDGSPIYSCIAVASILYLADDKLNPILKAQISYSSLGVAYYAFTAYQLLLQVSRLDKLSVKEVLGRIPTQAADALIEAICKRKSELTARPCWFAIASLCYRDLYAEFSAAKHAAICYTFKKIIAHLQGDRTNIDQLIINCSMRERMEGEYGFELYMRAARLDKVKMSRPLRVHDREYTEEEIFGTSPARHVPIQRERRGEEVDIDDGPRTEGRPELSERVSRLVSRFRPT